MFRERSAERSAGTINFWPSVVDIMAATALILFFVMAVLATLSYYRSQTYKQIADENTELVRSYKEITATNEELIRKYESVAAANELLIEKQKQLLDDISRIIEEREKTYQLLLQRLNDALGQEMVKRDETRLYIDTEILFVTNQFQLKPEGVVLAEKMGAVFYNLIREQEREQLDDPHGVQIISIEVIGHADYDGDFVRNRALSSNRSGTFVEQMLSILERNERLLFGRYIKASSMSVYNPVAGTVFQQNVEEKRRNRRIEFIINFSDKDFGYLLENYSNKNGAEK